MQTPTELEQTFYDNCFKREGEKFIDWCDKCKKYTEHTETTGHDGLDSYSYCICSECGNRY